MKEQPLCRRCSRAITPQDNDYCLKCKVALLLEGINKFIRKQPSAGRAGGQGV